MKSMVIKTAGYLVSTLSVFLLAALSLKSASESFILTLCLAVGVAASIAGMGLRWWSYKVQKEEES